jgi:Holliday junction resolvase
MGDSTDPNRFVNELVETLEAEGFTTLRPPLRRSGSILQLPELVAESASQVFLFLLATGQNPERIPTQAIDATYAHARRLGGRPRLALRRYGADWVFLQLDDLPEERGEYRIPDQVIEAYGIPIDEL